MTEKPHERAAHEEFTDLFSDYYDDELDADGRALLEAHLQQCEDCSEAYDAFRAPLDALHGMDFSFAPDDFVREVTRSINRQSRGSFFSESWLFGFRVPFEAFAAVLLAVFGALYLFGAAASSELVVSDAPSDAPTESRQPEDDLLGSALGSSAAVEEVELPVHVDLTTLAAQLCASGFAVRADISGDQDALVTSIAAQDLPKFVARVRALTGADIAPTHLGPHDGARSITVRLHRESGADGQ